MCDCQKLSKHFHLCQLWNGQIMGNTKWCKSELGCEGADLVLWSDMDRSFYFTDWVKV